MNSSVNENDNMPVTGVVSRIGKSGCEQAYEEWIQGISRESAKFKGHLGVSIIRPEETTYPEYVII